MNDKNRYIFNKFKYIISYYNKTFKKQHGTFFAAQINFI